MKQILRAIDVANALCGKQKYEEREKYRSASFIFALPVQEGVVLYNTLTGEMLALTETEYRDRLTDPALRKELARKLFLVPEGFSEKDYTDQVKAVVELLREKKDRIEKVMIFTTTDCNARCFYCYEMGRSRVPMSDEVAHAAAAYIIRACKGKSVKLSWFGGEPLFHQRPIEIITTELKNAGIEFASRMVSNGYLFDPETIKKARDQWKLRKVQITLDGTEQVYNRTKAYQNAEGSPFKRVLGNIAALLDAGIRVQVRMNLHKDNAEDLGKLIAELASRFSNREDFRAYVALLQDNKGSLIGFEGMEALESFRSLDAALLRYGLRKPKELGRGMRMNYCMADDDASITILPDGRLGKCEHYSESELVGSLFSEERDTEMIAAWKEPVDRIKECESCPYYPLCTHLKKCSYTSNTCTELDRRMRLSELEERVAASYAKAERASGDGAFFEEDGWRED